MSLNQPPEYPEGVFDLTARRTAKTFQEENAKLLDRIAELQAMVAQVGIDQTEGHGGPTEKWECRFHPSVIVDESKLTVTCRHCKAELNPFVVLNEFAKKERNFNQHLEWKKDESRQLAEEIEALKKERTRLRSQVNYARKTLLELRAQGATLPIKDTAP